ncbi:SHOCT domain-containing protein [Demequina sp.]|uniref:SHOCT domain-containing protein n=1 Tax=Demequina sp. TaxID=2050685 RepID=UPI0025DD9108|nr:SHOCT domain-containing protein [Demequina sp.]
MWSHQYGAAGFGAMWLVGFIVLVGIGVLIFAVVRYASSSGSNAAAPPAAAPATQATQATPPAASAVASSARTILEERFARGEIDPEEFAQRLRVLEGRDGGQTTS